mmetsp:Transcript_68605/g.223180  ORF Transcript_68605/g.223180 Transcript_68605/m.223180 type:complete len:219 (-) Transcript_68605:419-1075(-)
MERARCRSSGRCSGTARPRASRCRWARQRDGAAAQFWPPPATSVGPDGLRPSARTSKKCLRGWTLTAGGSWGCHPATTAWGSKGTTPIPPSNTAEKQTCGEGASTQRRHPVPPAGPCVGSRPAQSAQTTQTSAAPSARNGSAAAAPSGTLLKASGMGTRGWRSQSQLQERSGSDSTRWTPWAPSPTCQPSSGSCFPEFPKQWLRRPSSETGSWSVSAR